MSRAGQSREGFTGVAHNLKLASCVDTDNSMVITREKGGGGVEEGMRLA